MTHPIAGVVGPAMWRTSFGVLHSPAHVATRVQVAFGRQDVSGFFCAAVRPAVKSGRAWEVVTTID